MANSPSHRFGQIIGELLEDMFKVPLKAIAKKHGLYLDHKHARPARGNKVKVTWPDSKGNSHDLDYVLEHGGTEHVVGTPKAFIETAWRRYTKHSKNKVQEMQGAIVPIAETNSEHYPFLGAVVAGEYTETSLQQLRSHGFTVFHISYAGIVSAFSKVGIDASFDEDTSDSAMQAKVAAYEKLKPSHKAAIVKSLIANHKAEYAAFFTSLEVSLTRRLLRISIAALHGRTFEVESVADAIGFIERYDESQAIDGFVRYEVNLRYSNGDRITGEFEDKAAAVVFLRGIR